MPVAEIDGGRVAIKNIRSFTYDATGAESLTDYYNDDYEIDRLTGVWYGLSRFYGFALAHTFLSFEFDDGRYLVVSIEARQETGESYHPLDGLFRNYELIYVLGDERDIIGLRTHVRKEPVQLYKLELPMDEVRRLFGEILQDVNRIHEQPQFYNTITDNCTTSIMKYAKRISAWRRLTDYRILLPGYSDELAYELGVLRQDLPLSTLRERALVKPDGFNPGDPEFSRNLRRE